MAIMGAIVAGATDLTGAGGPGNFAAAIEKSWYVGYIATRILMPEGKQARIE
jgi:hypothetical protein